MAYMKTENNRIFYAPDNFDRAMDLYCAKSDIDCYNFAVTNVNSGEATLSCTIEPIQTKIDTIADRLSALEAAVAVSAQNKPPVSMQTWRYDRRSFKTLGADSRTPSLSRLFATN